MSRMRGVKPEFFTDEDIADDLTITERLFYIGLWTMCYDNWTMEYRPRSIKHAIFPFDKQVSERVIEAMVQRLIDTERAVLFDFEGKPCLYLPKCSDHQHVNRPSTSRIVPPSMSECDYSRSTHGALTEHSVGKEVKGSEVIHAHSSDSDFDAWYALYPKKVGKEAARRAYLKAVRSSDPNAIKAGLERAVASWAAENTERRFIPYPATWLNAGRWDDEQDTPTARDRFAGMGLEL